ncbi:MAG TPA: BON domain-containing protein [Ramlibacter sp.]|uniref:BON domain-containing protein n=1 Tax=Ramlibacter sp. TaxID=1917967 RepID=UPI002BE44E3C|nr:BON domain-containing protein [Ramlibacter sp.]HVZ42464.1 BON domain-containing protein [Ramlibacter sp.]
MKQKMYRQAAVLASVAALAALGACGERTQVQRPKADQASASSAMPTANLAQLHGSDPTHVMGASRGKRDRMDDSEIVQTLRTQFNADQDISAMIVDIDAKDGMVTLSGMVPNSDARVRADEMARSLRDVTSVNNELEVKAG